MTLIKTCMGQMDRAIVCFVGMLILTPVCIDCSWVVWQTSTGHCVSKKLYFCTCDIFGILPFHLMQFRLRLILFYLFSYGMN